jgi:hypothetical protein
LPLISSFFSIIIEMLFDKILNHPIIHEWLVEHGYRFDPKRNALPKLDRGPRPGTSIDAPVAPPPKHRWVRDKATGEEIVPVIDTYETPTEGGSPVITTKILKDQSQIRRAGSVEITDAEAAALRLYELNPLNVGSAKVLWLAGKTPSEAISSGYGVNTLKKIWAALNAANGIAPPKSNLLNRSRKTSTRKAALQSKALPSRAGRGVGARLGAV